MTHQGHRFKTLSQNFSTLPFFPGLGNFRKGKAVTSLCLAEKFMSKFVNSDTLDAIVNARSVVNFKVT